MKICTRCQESKDESEFQRDASRKDGLVVSCKKCRSEYYAGYYQKNREKKQAAWRMWMARNSDLRKVYGKRYREQNPDIYAAHAASRRSAQMLRTPNWIGASDIATIEAVYMMSKRVSFCTGVSHHVDHIVPLQGATVSGLHVPWNLRVIPAKANRQKTNKLGAVA